MAGFLRRHCERRLGVKVIDDRMSAVVSGENGDILAIETAEHGQVHGDFFIDCTGFRSKLLKEHFGVATKPLNHVLFADRALVVQVAHANDAPIRSTTMGTAEDAGWIWDIGLATRRGIGYVHSSAHVGAEDAEAALRQYLSDQNDCVDDISLRMLNFTSGYLERFWVRNCAATGLAAGFVEPLEASSIMLTEQAALELAELLPKHTLGTDHNANGFNDRFTKHWEQVADFLKLHYVLSERPQEFWRDNREPMSVPDTLAHDLEKWRTQIPMSADFSNRSALFPAESYQYVLYGVQGRTVGPRLSERPVNGTSAVHEQAVRLAKALPSNKSLLNSLHR